MEHPEGDTASHIHHNTGSLAVRHPKLELVEERVDLIGMWASVCVHLFLTKLGRGRGWRWPIPRARLTSRPLGMANVLFVCLFQSTYGVSHFATCQGEIANLGFQ